MEGSSERLMEAMATFSAMVLLLRALPEEELPQATLECAYLLEFIDLKITGDTYERSLQKDLEKLYLSLKQREKIKLSDKESFMVINLNSTNSIYFTGEAKNVWEKIKDP